MNPKQLKFLTLFEEMVGADYATDAGLKKHFTAFANLDFAMAVDVWDYLCTTQEPKLAKDEAFGKLMGGKAFDLLYAKNGAKTIKAVYDVPAVRRAVYQYAPVAEGSAPFTVLVDTLVANKTTQGEDIFKCLVKNERTPYGPFMKKLLERVFIEILKKSTSKKLEMPRKLATLLLSYVSKIRTDERAMLEQRIRETM